MSIETHRIGTEPPILKIVSKRTGHTVEIRFDHEPNAATLWNLADKILNHAAATQKVQEQAARRKKAQAAKGVDHSGPELFTFLFGTHPGTL